MRKGLFCVLMTALVLLSGCKAGGTRLSEAEQLALAVRSSYLAIDDCTATVNVTADYGQRVYQYTLDVAVTGDETTLTLTAPESVAGLVARLRAGEGFLEYDNLVLETGALDDQGLNPLSAIPLFFEQSRQGYIRASGLEDWQGTQVVSIDCGDPEGIPGQGRQVSLWFHADSHALLRGEVSIDGYRVILCEFTAFSTGE